MDGRDKAKYMLDDKVRAVLDLANDVMDSQFPPEQKRKVLTFLEKEGITYILDEIPEGHSYFFYTTAIDDYVVSKLKIKK